jgi:hypothetical protein
MGMMSRLGGEWKTITGGQIYAGGAWRTLVAIQIYSGGTWRQVANFTPPPSGGTGGTITVAASPNPCGTTRSAGIITTPTCTVTPSGGLAPYTYAWSILDGGLATIANPTLASTTFTRSSVPPNTEIDEIARCVVTDSLGTQATATVQLFFDHESLN